MGTNGLFGFRKDGIDKAVYVHYDSYPEYLGESFIRFINEEYSLLPSFFEKIVVVKGYKNPTKRQKEYCAKMGWINTTVADRNTNDWYCLLKNVQNLSVWKRCVDENKVILIENSIDFIKTSLFCEYAYIYDIDNRCLEFYKGFQKCPDEDNLYGTDIFCGYYPCKLLYRFSLMELCDTVSAVAKMKGLCLQDNSKKDKEEFLY